MPAALPAVSLPDIRAAAGRLRGAIEPTPCLHSRTLSRLTGAEVFLKFENLQFTASFKERGALNKLLSLGEAERKRGVRADPLVQAVLERFPGPEIVAVRGDVDIKPAADDEMPPPESDND